MGTFRVRDWLFNGEVVLMSLDAIYVLLTILGVAAIFGAVLRWRMGKSPPESDEAL